MNVLKILTVFAAFAFAAASFADAPRVGNELVKTNEEKVKKEVKNKKLSKARKNLESGKREGKASGTRSGNLQTE